MIFVTGDTHGFGSVDKLQNFAKANNGLTKQDFVIIAGDCGIVWNKSTLQQRICCYSGLPFSVLFIDGNHENFDMLNAYPVSEWNGGKVHKISGHIFHLMRGEVFTIEQKKFFTFGGAESMDKHVRQEGISWWACEVPSFTEYDYALTNLQKHNFTVDYIITHTCDQKSLYYPPLIQYGYLPLPSNNLLSNFEQMVNYQHWYFGHYHLDSKITNKKTAVFDEIIKLNTN